MDNTEIHVVPNILIMVGLASIGTNWFASRVCQDSLDASRFPRWKMLLMVWFAVAALLCYLLVIVVVLSYALQGHLEESLKVGWIISSLFKRLNWQYRDKIKQSIYAPERRLSTLLFRWV